MPNPSAEREKWWNVSSGLVSMEASQRSIRTWAQRNGAEIIAWLAEYEPEHMLLKRVGIRYR